MLKEFSVDCLNVCVYENRCEMGKAAAKQFYQAVKTKLKGKSQLNIIFAAAPSQNDFLESLKEYEDIEWGKINVFHMDEYVGLSITEKQSFAGYVKSRVVDNFDINGFYPLNGANADVDGECERYAKLLEENKIDIVCCGIGENGHLAFNDPGVADFSDKKLVKVIELDEVCRNQQVHDGCFATIDDVPKNAITLTIPALMSADEIICVVPCETKAEAVFNVVKGDISEGCPASILKTHKNARLYCDVLSAEKII